MLENSSAKTWHTEGAARFCIGDAFFRSSSQTGRDLAVLAAIAQRNHPANPEKTLRILDAMTGCGVRPLRYVLEAGADFVWANEGNWELRDRLQSNLSASLPRDRYCLTHRDANALFFDCYQRQDFYDLIDIDSFGSPTPTLSTSLWAIELGGLLYLTSTDGRTISGHAPDKSLQIYSAYARAHPAVHEQGLRLLIGTAVQQAAARGLTVYPVFCWYSGEVNRVMVRVTRQATWKTEHYGFLGYCHSCGQFHTVGWKKLGRGLRCSCNAETFPVISGPMWLGPLHNLNDLSAMADVAMAKISAGKQSTGSNKHQHYPGQKQAHPQDMGERWATCHKLLTLMQAEAHQPPYYYPLAEIGRRGKMDIPPKATLLSALSQQGYRATSTHIDPQAIKTDAPFAICLQLAKQLS
ncbi:MAG: tRNA (guanine-N1)-methyltransferase [Cyanobacteria bacterium J06627_32]